MSVKLVLLLAAIVYVDKCQTLMCNDSIILVRNSMSYFYAKAYTPPILANMEYYLNNMQASLLSAYQICFNKVIINPDSLYAKNNGNCLAGLRNASLLASKYAGLPDNRIYSEINSIADVVFQAACNCKEIIYYSGWKNVSVDCTSGMTDMDNLLNKYGDDVLLGGNGIKFLNDMLLLSERQRKNCGFNPLIKANTFVWQTCQSANIDWLYPLGDQYESLLAKKDVLNYTSGFYLIYQSIGRAQKLCVNSTVPNMTTS